MTSNAGKVCENQIRQFINETDILKDLTTAWGPFEESIHHALKMLSVAEMDSGADFLWFVLMPFDLRGIPISVWPAERNQQQHDGWPLEDNLRKCVPDTVELPEHWTGTHEYMDLLRDACAEFLHIRWSKIHPQPDRLAYFSMDGDGWYFSLRDGRKISAWDIEIEIQRELGRN